MSATLLARVERIAGVRLGQEELWAAGRDLERRIDRALRERPDLQQLLQEMQERTTEQAAEAGSTLQEFPSPQAVVEEREAYLRQLREQGEKGEE